MTISMLSVAQPNTKHSILTLTLRNWVTEAIVQLCKVFWRKGPSNFWWNSETASGLHYMCMKWSKKLNGNKDSLGTFSLNPCNDCLGKIAMLHESWNSWKRLTLESNTNSVRKSKFAFLRIPWLLSALCFHTHTNRFIYGPKFVCLFGFFLTNQKGN